MENYYTYIIQSTTTEMWYYGYTNKLEKRLTYHNEGKNVSTKNKGPWKYIFIRPFDSKEEAAKFERYLKRCRNKQYIMRAYTQWFV